MISNIILQFGAVFAPLGFAMFVISLQFAEGWKLYVGWGISLLFFLMGLWAFSEAMKIARKEQAESNRNFQELLREIRGFHQDMIPRGDNANDRSNNQNSL